MDNRFETFTVLISKIHKNIKKIKNIEMSKYDLKGIHVSIIYYLYIYNSLTAKELSEKCEEDKSSISRALKYLERNNYIICNSNYIKRYNSPFLLTVSGKEVGDEIIYRIDKVLEGINTDLNDEERIKFYNFLSEICDKLDDISNKM